MCVLLMSSSQSCEKYVRYSHDFREESVIKKFRLSVNEVIVPLAASCERKRRECVTTLLSHLSFYFYLLHFPLSMLCLSQARQSAVPKRGWLSLSHPSYHCPQWSHLSPRSMSPTATSSEGTAHVTSTRIAFHVPLVRGGLISFLCLLEYWHFLSWFLTWYTTFPIMLKLFLYFSLLK